MSIIDEIKTRLRKYPELNYTVDGDTISVDPPGDVGFPVSLAVCETGFVVWFDGWHEEFENQDEALNCFGFGLSNRCRLKVIKRGDTVCSWTVQRREGDNWRDDSSVGLVFVPFWRKKTVEYWQNDVIKIDEDKT